MRKIMIDILLHELLHLDEHKEEFFWRIYHKNRMFNKYSQLCYIMILINYILEINRDCVESIFCFGKLKCLAKRTCSGACYKFFYL
ncbi:hypothetical protein COI54_20410 [Bacillus wiedmannii]|nr:hypothetical protein CN599_25775 [Bacillus wiedmannii]PHG44456.1 hypothetical protein COI54_20410 [Bacillus wiedmannii]